MQKWFEVAEKSLEPEDNVIKNWNGQCEKKNGRIVLSTKKKILLVEEHGFIYKTADLLASNKAY